MEGQQILGAITFTYGMVEIPDPDPTAAAADTVLVAALFLGDEVLWHERLGVADLWHYGNAGDAQEIALNRIVTKLRSLFDGSP